MIGLIGAIGGGKSAVASLLRDRGAAVIDADAVGHRVLELPEVRGALASRFGPVAFGGDGRVDRRALGAIVFADAAARRDLEAIVHPEMRRRFERAVAAEQAAGDSPVIVLDAAILLEAGWDDLCDEVIYVDAPPEARLGRVARGRGWTAETLRAREAAQWPAEEKLARAARVVVNDKGLGELEHAVGVLLRDLLAAPGAAPREEASPAVATR
ncbi:dephospho-CoA kinase [Aquisphaera giovannonii]|uniref:dephospho-CoA kinase n=1 Tax=Aquisphaera giovannonii TaxID=406548 RepID=UPI001AEF3B11|nr:dephospho-CoA kinase [Aquisphaera giovannonii]